jgi:hypothetical protein
MQESGKRLMPKDRFIIEPHFWLQEWVAEEKGYRRSRPGLHLSGTDPFY